MFATNPNSRKQERFGKSDCGFAGIEWRQYPCPTFKQGRITGRNQEPHAPGEIT